MKEVGYSGIGGMLSTVGGNIAGKAFSKTTGVLKKTEVGNQVSSKLAKAKAGIVSNLKSTLDSFKEISLNVKNLGKESVEAGAGLKINSLEAQSFGKVGTLNKLEPTPVQKNFNKIMKEMESSPNAKAVNSTLEGNKANNLPVLYDPEFARFQENPAEYFTSKGAGKADDFVGVLKGQNVTLKDVKAQSIQYTKRSGEELTELRKAFNKTERKNFLNHLSGDDIKVQQLKEAGLSDLDIQMMKDGLVPKGYQVHHKLPLDGGGTNSIDNLILIKNDPYHKVITNTQNALTKGLEAGDTMTINNWPIPEGYIYPNK